MALRDFYFRSPKPTKTNIELIDGYLDMNSIVNQQIKTQAWHYGCLLALNGAQLKCHKIEANPHSN